MPSKSKQQQKFFGVVKAMQKGDIPKKGEAGKVAKDMTKKDVDKYASTKHKGLPKKVKEGMINEGKGYSEARKLITQLRSKTYRGLDDDELLEFRKEMIEHLGGTLNEARK